MAADTPGLSNACCSVPHVPADCVLSLASRCDATSAFSSTSFTVVFFLSSSSSAAFFFPHLHLFRAFLWSTDSENVLCLITANGNFTRDVVNLLRFTLISSKDTVGYC